MEKLLSIVIPTLNRYQYLKRTLDLIIPQVQRNIEEVELVICCNSSKDETDEYVKSLLPQYPFIRYKYFDEYVEVGQSLIRSVGEATGKFVVLWGDDDIPFPFFTEIVLDIIKKNPGIGIIHCNRLQGKDTRFGFKNLTLTETTMDDQEPCLYDLGDFVQKFTISLGFISSLIFRKDDFLSATSYYNTTHYGYEHLSIIVNGAKGKKCYYHAFPIEIQRVPYNRDFSNRWALYHFVGIPNMMKDFDKFGICQNALAAWDKSRASYGNASFLQFVWFMMYATLDKAFYKPRIKELNMYQSSLIRRLLTYSILYLCPKSLFMILRKNRF